MYPKRVKEFIPWTKAMVAGATVGNPSYSKTGSKRKMTNRRKRRNKRKRKKKNAD